jgi:hopanoid biosynthesis associated protein HpnK
MPSAPAAAQAFALARELPDLCVGVHLTLIQGRAVLPPEELPGLVDSQGRFLDDPVRTGWRYFKHPRLRSQIRRELAAQIEAVLAAGLTPWFLNSHVNLHMHPGIFPVVADLAREYGVPALRLTREDWRTTLALAPDHPLPKVAQGLIFSWLSRRARRQAEEAHLLVNDHLFGLTHDGRMTEDYLLGLAPRLRPGVTEIYCHPALYADRELSRWAPNYQRQAELTALLSLRLRDALTAADVELTVFRELVLRAGIKSGS